MELETVLAPVDGSDESLAALDYAVAIAERYDAGVHALYVFGEGVVRGLEAGDVSADDLATETEEFMARARERADGVTLTHSTAYGYSPTSLRQHPGSVILDAADDADADFLVVPREPVTGDPSEVLEKAAEYVLAYASQPVLSV